MTGTTWSASVFEALYRNDPDPWGFTHDPYERDKLDHVLAMLPGAHFRRVLELGCAIGVGTRALAANCDELLALDASATALAAARLRCADLVSVQFVEAFLPDGFPREFTDVDLGIVSELLYFLGEADIERLAAQVVSCLIPGGHVLIANWTGATDTPCSGHQAARVFIATCLSRGCRLDRSDIRASYRIDRLQRL